MARLPLVVLVAVCVLVAQQSAAQRVQQERTHQQSDEQAPSLEDQQRLQKDTPGLPISTKALPVTRQVWNPYQEAAMKADPSINTCTQDVSSRTSSKTRKEIQQEAAMRADPSINTCGPDVSSRTSSKTRKEIRQEKMSKKTRPRDVREDSVCLQDKEYDTCISPSSIDGYCTCDDGTHSIHLIKNPQMTEAADYYLRYCLDRFADESKFRYYRLEVTGFDDLLLEGEILGKMLFDEVIIDRSTVRHIDPEFLGMSRNVTRYIEISEFVEKIPVIEAHCLEELYLTSDSSGTVKLRPSSLKYLDKLTYLRIESKGWLEIQRNSLRHNKRLKEVHLNNPWGDIRLVFGSLVFHSEASVEYIWIDTLTEAAAGSIAPMPGTTVDIGSNEVGWSPTIWFNLLAGGGRLWAATPDDNCDCSIAWIYRSSFLQNTVILCKDRGYLHQLPSYLFDHC